MKRNLEPHAIANESEAKVPQAFYEAIGKAPSIIVLMDERLNSIITKNHEALPRIMRHRMK